MYGESVIRSLGPSERFLASCNATGDLTVSVAVCMNGNGIGNGIKKSLGEALRKLRKLRPQLKTRLYFREEPTIAAWTSYVNPLNWFRAPLPLLFMELHDLPADVDVDWKVVNTSKRWEDVFTDELNTPFDNRRGLWRCVWYSSSTSDKQILMLFFHPVLTDFRGSVVLATELIKLINLEITGEPDKNPLTASGIPLPIESLMPISKYNFQEIFKVAYNALNFHIPKFSLWTSRYQPPRLLTTALKSKIIAISLSETVAKNLLEEMNKRGVSFRALVTAVSLMALKKVAPPSTKGVVPRINTCQEFDLRPYCSRGNGSTVHGPYCTYNDVAFDVDGDETMEGLWALAARVVIKMAEDPNSARDAHRLCTTLMTECYISPTRECSRIRADFTIATHEMDYESVSNEAVSVSSIHHTTIAPHMGTIFTHQASLVGGVIAHTLTYYTRCVLEENALKYGNAVQEFYELAAGKHIKLETKK